MVVGLTGLKGILDDKEAMELLSEVAHRTQWSCVYNLNKFSVTVCGDENYDKGGVTFTDSDF